MASPIPDQIEIQSFSDNSNSSVENMEIETLDEFTGELELQSSVITTEESQEAEDTEPEDEMMPIEELETQQIDMHSEDQARVVEQVNEKKSKSSSSVPPLRLLNIAPKPEQVPITVKSVGGQPLILVPGSTGAQTIKLVNPQGQEINWANYSISRPITIKQTGKAISTKPVVPQSQPKQIFMKKIITSNPGQKTITKPISFNKSGQQFMVVQKSSDQPQQIKLVQSANVTGISPTPPVQSKTITLQQAHDMGLLGNAKIIQGGIQPITKRTVLMNKSQPKTIKLVPHSAASQILGTTNSVKTISLGQIKSPTKISPGNVTNVAGTKGAQRIIFKNAGGNQLLPAGQLIHMTGTQGITNGQIHQINVPGKGVQYIKFVTTTSVESSSSTVTLVNTIKSTASTSAAGPELQDVKPVITSKFITKPSTGNLKPAQVMIVPAGYIPTNMQQMQKVAIGPKQPVLHPKQEAAHSVVVPRTLVAVDKTISPKSTSSSSPTAATTTVSTTESSSNTTNGIRPRKPCNCTRSKCLKLYCDCFANGEFCYLCNCMCCYNNLEHEDTRNLAIKACLERNPNAFRPKIGKARDTTGDVLRKHTKGCNCKRSGCLKNYCECYEAKIACSSNCKCYGCRNVEDFEEKVHIDSTSSTHRINEDDLAQTRYRKILPSFKENHSSGAGFGRSRKSNLLRKQPVSYLTDPVIEAACQCLLTTSDNADSNLQDEELTMREIIEEFGGCLSEIIHCSINRNTS
ncbi:protein lin-54 homolog isoform X1 [Dendroctonus ponderosae]|uniref:protein lin-54 homolog isoform X1 n=1 Tax=Dendroctonus ponderosae TaxID=77166 RepID=UPI0020363080|nr:protein lin-54 homolog isoform X1 [Dendroctonus ponderosae]KAH1025596.1 hypothetical protein HUJ05_010291 [Dendroctonus ponderosae]